MTIKRVFKNTMPNTQYLFKNGKSAQFVGGRYETDNSVEIFELDSEIQNGIPHLYIDLADSQVDTGMQDYVREAQIAATKRAIVEYEAAKAAETDRMQVALVAPVSPQAESPATPVLTPNVATIGINPNSLNALLAQKATPSTGIATSVSTFETSAKSA